MTAWASPCPFAFLYLRIVRQGDCDVPVMPTTLSPLAAKNHLIKGFHPYGIAMLNGKQQTYELLHLEGLEVHDCLKRGDHMHLPWEIMDRNYLNFPMDMSSKAHLGQWRDQTRALQCIKQTHRPWMPWSRSICSCAFLSIYWHLLDMFCYKLKETKMSIGPSFTAMPSQSCSSYCPYIAATVAISRAIPRSNHESLWK